MKTILSLCRGPRFYATVTWCVVDRYWSLAFLPSLRIGGDPDMWWLESQWLTLGFECTYHKARK